jgi:hypothetical protein
MYDMKEGYPTINCRCQVSNRHNTFYFPSNGKVRGAETRVVKTLQILKRMFLNRGLREWRVSH